MLTCTSSPVWQVDCTANTETCTRFGVTGYPTLKIFRNGRDSAPYDGPRTAGKTSAGRCVKACVWTKQKCVLRACIDGICHFMGKQTGPDSVQLKTNEDLQKFIQNYDASIIGESRSCHIT